MRSQSVSASGVVSAGTPGTPAVWVSTCRIVVDPFPWAAYSGQMSATRVSYPKTPLSTSTTAIVEVSALPSETP